MKIEKTKELNRSDILFCLARIPESGRLFFGSSDFNVYTIDVDAEKPEAHPLDGDGHESYVTGIALASGHVVSGGYDGRLIWWDAEERREVRSVDAHDRWIRRVISTPDRQTIVSVADDMVCKLWNAQSGELIREVTDHETLTPHHYPSMLYAVTVSPDGQLLATADKTGHIAVWEFSTGKQLGELEAPIMYTWDPRQRRHSIGGIRSLAFSHDSNLLAAGGIGQIGNIDHLGGPSRVEVFDWRQNKRLHELEDDKFKGLVEQLCFHPGGEWFLAAGGDHNGFMTFYETKTGKVLHQEKAPMHVHGYEFSESYDRLFAVGHERIVVWELSGVNPQGDDAPAVAAKPQA